MHKSRFATCRSEFQIHFFLFSGTNTYTMKYFAVAFCLLSFQPLFIDVLLVKTQPFKALAITSKAKDHLKMMACAKPFLESMGAGNNFSVDVTDDTSQVNEANLARYQVFIMLQEAPFDMSTVQQA